MIAPSSRPDTTAREHADTVQIALDRLSVHEHGEQYPEREAALNALKALLAYVERLEGERDAEICEIPPKDWEPAKAEWHQFHLDRENAQRTRAEAAEALAERRAVALRKIEMQASRQKRASNLKRYLVTDLEIIERIARTEIADGGQENPAS